MWKQLTTLTLFVTTGFVLGGCDRDPIDNPAEYDVRGLTLEEQSDVIAEAMCTKMAQCPFTEYSCTAQPGGPEQCTGEIIRISETSCIEEMKEEILEDLDEVDITPEVEQAINDCLNAYAAQECLTEAQLQANIDAVEAGGEPPYEQEMVPECVEMVDLLFPGQGAQPSDPE